MTIPHEHAEVRRRAREQKRKDLFALITKHLDRAKVDGTAPDILVSVKVSRDGGIKEVEVRSIVRDAIL
jgi:hypothetical protein